MIRVTKNLRGFYIPEVIDFTQVRYSSKRQVRLEKKRLVGHVGVQKGDFIMRKKFLGVVLATAMAAGCLAGCGSQAGSSDASSAAGSGDASSAESEASSDAGNDAATGDFDNTKYINVVSREDGSGTRGAFIELTGVEEKDADGNKVDNTTTDAAITNNTSVMMSTVKGDTYSIGYISLGSLNKDVKALNVDGVEATAENVKSGDYTLSRPFNIVTKGTVGDAAQDFINYIMSDDGQKVVVDEGYVDVSSGSFESTQAEGKIVVAGSSSVSPVMEKLKEAYASVNPNATIEIQTSDSTTGVESTINGICDIGMASRELKDSETEQGVEATVIAKDGIAVIVNNANPLTDITKDQIKSIYVGELTKWDELK